MHIVLCADEGYIDKATTVMASILCHSRSPGALRFHLLGHGITATSRGRLEAWFETLPARLNLIETLEGTTPKWGQLFLGRFGPATMLRLSMERWLPAEVRRVVYLDCDVLVFDDIATLMDIDLQEHSIAAVMNLQNDRQERMGGLYTHYFNSGVLLVDLDRWKAREVVARTEQRLAAEPEITWRYPDQDALNLIFPDWLPLPLRWNMQPYAYSATEKRASHYAGWHQELLDAVSRPAIVHFIGATKPWHAASRHPLAPLFLDYMRLTPWPPTLTAEKKVRKLQHPKLWRRRRRLRQAPCLSLPRITREHA